MRYIETSIITKTNIDDIFNFTCELLNNNNNNNNNNNTSSNTDLINMDTISDTITSYRYSYFSNYC